MIRYVIVDDNQKYSELLKDIIISSMASTKCEFEITSFYDYTKELKEYISSNREDTVYLLDLELPNGSGIEIARYIRNECNDWRDPIIICTAYSSLSYEIKSLRLQLLEFVGKNIDTKKNMEELIEICLTMFNHPQTYKFTYKNIDYNIAFNKINYIQREDRKVKIVTVNGDFYHVSSIIKAKKALPNYFVTSTKGILVNTRNIKHIDWSNLLLTFNDNTSYFIVSRIHKKELGES